jgi:hypothetical protein
VITVLLLGLMAVRKEWQPSAAKADASLTLFLGAYLQVILKLILRIKLSAANSTFVRLSRFVFFCHAGHLLSISLVSNIDH